MKSLIVQTATPYSIYIDHHLLNTTLLKETCEKLNKRPVIITDSHLQNNHAKNLQQQLKQQGLTLEVITFPAGEIHKTRETKQQLEDELLAKSYGRDTCLIALGGGVVSDLVGFVAATYCRGIPVIYIPTTLLAMVDACMGGKTAVNTSYGKNLIGTFTQPHTVFIETNYLNSLPHHEYQNGLVEMIKHSFIADPSLFELLKKQSQKIKARDPLLLIELIYTNCLIKRNIIEQDESEHDLRQLLNFGHTIGHAIETIENYHLGHGEAVAIGMLVETYLSVEHGFLNESYLSELQNILRDYELPLQTIAFQNINTFKSLLKLDKKSINQTPRFVMIDKIGFPHIEQNHYTMTIEPIYLDKALDWAKQLFHQQA